MIKERIVIFLIILFTGVACIPDTPTGNVVDPLSSSYTLPPPKDLEFKRLGNGQLRITMDPQSLFNITGQEVFIVKDGEIFEQYMIEVDATSGLGFIRPAFLEFPQTYAVRSYFEFNNEDSPEAAFRYYSDFAYATLPTRDILGIIYARISSNQLSYNPKFVNPSFRIELEYAPDSVNFVTLENRLANLQSSIIYDNFFTEFDNDIDGIIRHKLIYQGIESDYVSTADPQFSTCADAPTPTEIPELDGRASPFNTNAIFINFSVHNECFDEIFIYLKTENDSEFQVIERWHLSPSSTVIEPPSTENTYIIKVAGIRHGITSFESEEIRMIYENGGWVKDE
jgi:hypothetical protein